MHKFQTIETKFITGVQKPIKNFTIEEFANFDLDKVLDVLDGKCLGAIFRDFIPKNECHQISKNFSNYDNRYFRSSDAPADYAGAFSYSKAPDVYFQEATEANQSISQLFDKTTLPVDRLVNNLSLGLKKRGRNFRAARWNDMEACHFVMRSWAGQGSFALNPHEDEAQCQLAIQNGLEIQDAVKEHPLAAVNICIENGNGGLLRIWNVRPDNATRERLGLTATGSPYPPDLLNEFPYIDIKIRPGDLYLFDGRFVHAVTQLNGGPDKSSFGRITIAFLMAHLGTGETIQWT